MLELLGKIFEGLLGYALFFAVAKYVFLEPGATGLKRKILHVLGVIGTIGGVFYAPLDIIELIVFVVWILSGYSRKEYVRGLIIFPILGVGLGITTPALIMPATVFDAHGFNFLLFKIIVSAVLTVGLVILQVRVDKADEKIEIGNNILIDRMSRKLSLSEKVILYAIGVFEFIFVAVLVSPLSELSEGLAHPEDVLRIVVALLGVSTFTLTITVISIVLVGNKRSFYQKKVTNMQFNTIVTMAEIVENRDADTGGHIQRTAKYVEIISNHMRRGNPYSKYMTDQFLEDIRIAAPLHDVGKIHVSDAILNFPGRLSEEQFEEMKTHAAEGKKLLLHTKQHMGEFSYLDMAIDMAAYHHEWWDGSAKGYPEHLKGEEIPLCARIMAVADVFDALTAKRVYKEPMPYRKAFKIIQEESGTHFDPVVVDAFVGCFDKIKTALKAFEAGEVYMMGHTLEKGVEHSEYTH